MISFFPSTAKLGESGFDGEYDIWYRHGMGRRQINYEQVLLRLPEGTLVRLDALLRPKEKRAEMLRDAVEAEVRRRERERRRVESGSGRL